MDKFKENAMKASYFLTALALGLSLTACQGSNPFKFQSDPVEDKYASLKDYKTLPDEDMRPQVAVLSEGWPTESVAYGEFFTFKVQVYDPASTASLPPVLGEAEFKAPLETQSLSDAPAVIDGASAVECKSKALSLGDGKWEFNCTFNTKDLHEVNGYLKSEKTLSAMFDLSAISRNSGLSTSVNANVPVIFTKASTAKENK
jgi:hypothetical protein